MLSENPNAKRTVQNQAVRAGYVVVCGKCCGGRERHTGICVRQYICGGNEL